MIHIRYFASLREELGTDGEEMTLPGDVTDMAALARHLRGRGGVWQQAFAADRTLMMAVNQEAARADSQVKDGDELAFFPPVTGG